MSVTAPASFLDIVQRLARECRVPGTGPSTVVSQTGLLARLVNWASAAWVEIQAMHPEDWNFLRQSASWTTVAGTSLYPLGTGAGTVGVAASAFGSWITRATSSRDSTFRCYTTSVGTTDEQVLDRTGYDAWRDTYLMSGARSVRSRPVVCAIDDAFGVALGPVPAAGYTITADYRRKPVFLEADADIPACPREYFMLIVYLAMKKYGAGEGAPRLYQEGAAEYNKMLPQMERACLPRPRLMGGLG